MPDTPFGSEQMQSLSNTDCNAVCIDAARIYDSCGAKDCLSDLPLMFAEEDQCLVERACSVRINRASLITSTVDVEAVAFHKGFYSVDMVFYFVVSVDVYTSTGAIPTTINGLAKYGKRVVLFGSDGDVKTFSSDSPIKCADSDKDCSCAGNESLPKATVHISNPMALSAKLVKCKGMEPFPCGAIPQCVAEYFGCNFAEPSSRQILATIGIFTITQLERNVQLMIPSYDFCIPRKECTSKTDDPCEVFSKIEFPTDSFFPPNVGDCTKGKVNFECDCDE